MGKSEAVIYFVVGFVAGVFVSALAFSVVIDD